MSDPIEKYKKVSFLKNNKKQAQTIYNPKSIYGLKSERFKEQNTSKTSFGMISHQSQTKSFTMKRDSDYEQTNQNETRLTTTNHSHTSISVANPHELSQDLDRFKKMNKLLFFSSQKRSNNTTNREDRVISDISNNNIKNEGDRNEKIQSSSSFLTHEIFLSARSKQNIGSSYYITTKKPSLKLDKIDISHNRSEYLPKQQQISYLVSSQQDEKIKQSQRDSFQQKIKNSRYQTNILSDNQTNNMNITFQSQKSDIDDVDDNKNDGNFPYQRDEIIESSKCQSTTSLQKIISRTNIPQLAINSSLRQANQLSIPQNIILQIEENDDYTSPSPLTKRLQSISLKSNSKIKKQFQTFESQSNNLISNFLDGPYTSSQEQIKQSLMDRQQQTKNKQNTLSTHNSRYNQSHDISMTQRVSCQSPQKMLQIKNLKHYTKNIEPSSQNTPVVQHHFNSTIKKQINLIPSSSDNRITQNSSNDLIKLQSESSQKSIFHDKKRYNSKTQRSEYSKEGSQTSIRLIPPPAHQVLKRSPHHYDSKNRAHNDSKNRSHHDTKNRSSHFFTSYVASTFKNSLMELRKRTQMQIYQKLSFESRQTLKRLVIYINDMVEGYANIKKVSQVIYQLIYHIPYLVNMLFQNEKILLKEGIDLNYISLFLTNKANIDCNHQEVSESYEQILDNKIQSDIVFLNEKLTEYIKRKFSDRFDLISQNIIEEYEKVQNLESEIEERIYRNHRLCQNVNSNILHSKHNYNGIDHYMFHNKNTNAQKFAQTFYKETVRLGDFNCIDQQNVTISNELDNLYRKVQNQTLNKQDNNPFPIVQGNQLIVN